MAGQLAAEITVPNVKMSLDQLLAVVRKLDESGRALIARVLLESKMDDELGDLLQELAATPPANDITDAEIQAEVRAVRELGTRAGSGASLPSNLCRRYCSATRKGSSKTIPSDASWDSRRQS
jgi:hypothetical protein